MTRTDTWPDPTRTDSGLILTSIWRVGTTERQQAVVAAIVEAYADRPGVDGLLSYSVFVGTDGDTVRHYTLWRDEDAYQAFFADGRQQRVDRIDTAVPGIERLDLTRYRLYRGQRVDPAPRPGALVAVQVQTPDEVTARSWVDAVLVALDADRASADGPPEGGIGGFFHISEDGTRVLNFAEWSSVQAHADALAANGGSVSRGPLWDRVRAFPGVRQVGVDRFHLAATFEPTDPADGVG
ncbi:antibiotic biosynthesis monooxygenase [Micromonospora sp. NPDC000207]|uniref:antibiotic biosynthesis monooxygenase n=1 Tax=Micromonospora sp. NPDC000207 TaxID=3154246 RepID=UPI003327B81E